MFLPRCQVFLPLARVWLPWTMLIVPVYGSNIWVSAGSPILESVNLVVPTINSQEHPRWMPDYISDTKYWFWVGFETA